MRNEQDQKGHEQQAHAEQVEQPPVVDRSQELKKRVMDRAPYIVGARLVEALRDLLPPIPNASEATNQLRGKAVQQAATAFARDFFDRRKDEVAAKLASYDDPRNTVTLTEEDRAQSLAGMIAERISDVAGKALNPKANHSRLVEDFYADLPVFQVPRYDDGKAADDIFAFVLALQEAGRPEDGSPDKATYLSMDASGNLAKSSGHTVQSTRDLSAFLDQHPRLAAVIDTFSRQAAEVPIFRRGLGSKKADRIDPIATETISRYRQEAAERAKQEELRAQLAQAPQPPTEATSAVEHEEEDERPQGLGNRIFGLFRRKR